MINTALLICCSLLCYASMTRLAYSENLARHAPYSKSEVMGSRAELRNGMELPYYPTGFK